MQTNKVVQFLESQSKDLSNPSRQGLLSGESDQPVIILTFFWLTGKHISNSTTVAQKGVQVAHESKDRWFDSQLLQSTCQRVLGQDT